MQFFRIPFKSFCMFSLAVSSRSKMAVLLIIRIYPSFQSFFYFHSACIRILDVTQQISSFRCNFRSNDNFQHTGWCLANDPTQVLGSSEWGGGKDTDAAMIRMPGCFRYVLKCKFNPVGRYRPACRCMNNTYWPSFISLRSPSSTL